MQRNFELIKAEVGRIDRKLANQLMSGNKSKLLVHDIQLLWGKWKGPVKYATDAGSINLAFSNPSSYSPVTFVLEYDAAVTLISGEKVFHLRRITKIIAGITFDSLSQYFLGHGGLALANAFISTNNI